MKRERFGLLAALAGCAGTMALVAAPALASKEAGGTDPQYPGSVIHVSAPPVREGHPLEITVSGTNVQPVNNAYGGGPDFVVTLFWQQPDHVPGQCPASKEAEGDVADANPSYASVITGNPLNAGVGGTFKFTLPFSAIQGFGPVKICAYTTFYAGGDAAWGTTTTQILPPAKGTSTTSTTPGKTGQTGKTGAKPAATTKPHVMRGGSELFCERGNWSGSPKSYRYAWTVVHKHGVAGTKSVLRVTGAMHGHQVTCSVTAKNSAGSATAISRPLKIK